MCALLLCLNIYKEAVACQKCSNWMCSFGRVHKVKQLLLSVEMAGVGPSHHGRSKRSEGQCEISVHSWEVHRPSLQQWSREYHSYDQWFCNWYCSYVQWLVLVIFGSVQRNVLKTCKIPCQYRVLYWFSCFFLSKAILCVLNWLFW